METMKMYKTGQSWFFEKIKVDKLLALDSSRKKWEEKIKSNKIRQMK